MKRLLEQFGNVLADGGGIFEVLPSEHEDIPWLEDVSSTSLDIEYFYNVSGQKRCSPLVSRLAELNTPLTGDEKKTLADVIYNMYIKNWLKEYETLSFEYNPIENYRMIETEGVTEGVEGTRTNTGTQSVEGEGSVTTDTTQSIANGVYGMNSSTSVGDTDSSSAGHDATESETSNTRTDDLTEETSEDKTIDRELTRSGNIGVTTSQQMIQSERELYFWNFFREVVFPDVDKVLSLTTY